MPAFENLMCISLDGTEVPMYPSGEDNLFTNASELARRARNAKIVEIRWRYWRSEKKASFDYIDSAALDRTNDLLVVVLHFADAQCRRPANAIVINPDGTLDHTIQPPEFVLLPDASHPTERHKVVAIEEVSEKNGRILIGLNYRYDKVERRYYDPLNRPWQERDQIYRR